MAAATRADLPLPKHPNAALYLNGWCARETHHYCPDSPGGGLGGTLTLGANEWRSCTCNCHRDQQTLFSGGVA